MKIRILCLAAVFSAPLVINAADPLLKEPPLNLIVSVGGKEMPIAPGEAKKLEGEFKDPEVKVTMASVRTFSLAGISFDFPAGWNWEAEKIEGGYTWTMEGPDVTLLVNKYDHEVDAKELAEGIAEPEDRKAKVEPWSETHAGREFKGWRVTADFSGHTLQFYILPIPVKEGSATLQIIDSAEKGKNSAEFRTTLEMLGKTMKAEGK